MNAYKRTTIEWKKGCEWLIWFFHYIWLLPCFGRLGGAGGGALGAIATTTIAIIHIAFFLLPLYNAFIIGRLLIWFERIGFTKRKPLAQFEFHSHRSAIAPKCRVLQGFPIFERDSCYGFFIGFFPREKMPTTGDQSSSSAFAKCFAAVTVQTEEIKESRNWWAGMRFTANDQNGDFEAFEIVYTKKALLKQIILHATAGETLSNNKHSAQSATVKQPSRGTNNSIASFLESLVSCLFIGISQLHKKSTFSQYNYANFSGNRYLPIESVLICFDFCNSVNASSLETEHPAKMRLCIASSGAAGRFCCVGGVLQGVDDENALEAR